MLPIDWRAPCHMCRNMLLKDLQDEEEMLMKAFQFFDKDGNGEISITELKTTMHELGDLLTEQEIQLFVSLMDDNNDGVIGVRWQCRACGNHTHTSRISCTRYTRIRGIVWLMRWRLLRKMQWIGAHVEVAQILAASRSRVHCTKHCTWSIKKCCQVEGVAAATWARCTLLQTLLPCYHSQPCWPNWEEGTLPSLDGNSGSDILAHRSKN
jgi:hypothetical protein